MGLLKLDTALDELVLMALQRASELTGESSEPDGREGKPPSLGSGLPDPTSRRAIGLLREKT